MKKILLFLFFSLSVQAGIAQEYLDRIGQKTCECVGKIGEGDSRETKKLHLMMGLCIIQSINADEKKRLQSDFGLDFQTDQEKIGRKIGEVMMTQCPTSLVKILSTNSSESISGVVTKLENESFVVLHVKEKSGAVSKFIWLSPIESVVDLPSSYQNLLGKSVEIQFEPRPLFDPKIGEYRSFKVLTKIK
ncbi:hypothetical protein BH11PSE11_BH11PSE11_38520 [soil metagenome]